MAHLNVEPFTTIKTEHIIIALGKNVFGDEAIFESLSVPVKARLLKNLTQFKSVTLNKQLDSLIKNTANEISENLAMLEENSVLTIMEAVSNMKIFNKFSGQSSFEAIKNLSHGLNGFVIKMAEQQPDLVDSKFLVQFMASLNELHSNLDLKVKFDKQKSIITMCDRKMQQKGDIEQFRDRELKQLFELANSYTKDMPNTCDMLFAKFLSPNTNTRVVSEALRSTIIMINKMHADNETAKAAAFQQIMDKVESGFDEYRKYQP